MYKVKPAQIILLCGVLLSACSGGGGKTAKADNTAPIVGILNPMASIYKGDINITWKTTETNPAQVKIELLSEGGPVKVVEPAWKDSGSYILKTTGIHDDGVYRIKITAQDVAGNTGTGVESPSFVIDNTPPKIITWKYPIDSGVYGGEVPLQWETDDANPDTVAIFAFNKDNRDLLIPISENAPDIGRYVWQGMGLSGDGFGFLIRATDKAGSQSRDFTTPATYTLDFVAPETGSIPVSYENATSNTITLGVPMPMEQGNTLEYSVYYSDLPNLSTTADIAANGTLALDWLNGNGSDFKAKITGVDSAVDKYWNILVRDGFGQTSTYGQSRAHGILDPGFGLDTHPADGQGDGFLYHPLDGDQRDFEVAQQDAKFLVAGKTGNPAKLILWRLNADGSLDNTFGPDEDMNGKPDGFIIHNAVTLPDAFYLTPNVGILSDGQIIVAGSGPESAENDLIIWRLTTDGILDETFGVDYDGNGKADGYIRHNGSTANDLVNEYVYHLFIDQADNLIVSGLRTHQTGIDESIIWRINKNGVLDEGFGNPAAGGKRSGFFSSAGNGFKKVVFDGSGRIIAYSNIGNDSRIDRITSQGEIDSGFNPVSLQISTIESIATDMLNNRLIVLSRNGLSNSSDLRAYELDTGQADKSFAANSPTPGIVDPVPGRVGGFNLRDLNVWNGNIYFSGNYLDNGCGCYAAFLGRVTANGILDRQFNLDGNHVFHTSEANGDDWASRIVFAQDKLYLFGYGEFSATRDLVVWRHLH